MINPSRPGVRRGAAGQAGGERDAHREHGFSLEAIQHEATLGDEPAEEVADRGAERSDQNERNPRESDPRKLRGLIQYRKQGVPGVCTTSAFQLACPEATVQKPPHGVRSRVGSNVRLREACKIALDDSHWRKAADWHGLTERPLTTNPGHWRSCRLDLDPKQGLAAAVPSPSARPSQRVVPILLTRPWQRSASPRPQAGAAGRRPQTTAPAARGRIPQPS